MCVIEAVFGKWPYYLCNQTDIYFPSWGMGGYIYIYIYIHIYIYPKAVRGAKHASYPSPKEKCI